MPSVELLRAEITRELAKLGRLEEFLKVADLLDRSASEVGFFDRAAIGYYLHSFYNGCENIFRSIARFFENELSDDSWHSDLLRRMILDVEGYRPAVIDEELYTMLQDLRGFRHVFRHSYTFELDWERERLVARKLSPALARLRTQLQAFLTRLDELRA